MQAPSDTSAPRGVTGVWLSALRPRTLAAGAVPVAVGAALGLRHGTADWLIITGCLAGALLLQIASNFANDAFDFIKGADTSDRLGPARATQKGWVTPRQMLGATTVVVGLALLLGSWLVSIGGWPIAAIGISGAVCAVAYTGGPVPLGYVGLGDILVFAFFGPAAVIGTTWLQPSAAQVWHQPETWLAACAIGALATAILVVNNLRDRHTDAACGKRTLAVRLGARGARLEWTLLVGGAYLAVAVAAMLDTDPMWLLPWLSAPLAVRTGLQVWRVDGAALNPLLGKTAQLETLFGALLALGLGL
ncbi:MAG: 1,4-dihydroxy-2-naphthoate polyprenyltransferase [Myxococcales bacterium]|nr:1,4-dihydroxy-2-naphthoate polyprenyltransferase [Myxococcales bacterium]